MIKVSALVSMYRAEEYLASALDNLLAQTMGEALEIILVNSGSPENEAPIVQRFQARYPGRIVYLETPRETLYSAWNRAIGVARGSYLINANVDDRLSPQAYELMVDALDHSPTVGLVYADVFVTRKKDDVLLFQTLEPKEHWRRYVQKEYSHKQLLMGCLCGPQPMWRKSLHETLGLFDDSFQVAGDWEFWLRASELTPFKHLNQFLGLYFNNPDGLENSLSAVHRGEILKIQSKYCRMQEC